MSAPVTETHGALSFRRGTGNSKSAYRCTDHPGKGYASGRWRLAIAGMPVLGENGHEVRLCSFCRKRLEALYDEVLMGEELPVV